MPRSRRFSPPTRTDKQRADIALLSIVWLAVTCVGMSAVVRATATINARAVAQTGADTVALVAADRGELTARRIGGWLGVDIVTIETSGPSVTVEVRVGDLRSSASAVKPE